MGDVELALQSLAGNGRLLERFAVRRFLHASDDELAAPVSTERLAPTDAPEETEAAAVPEVVEPEPEAEARTSASVVIPAGTSYPVPDLAAAAGFGG